MPLVHLTATPSKTMRRWFGLSLASLLLLFAWFASRGSASWSLPLAAGLCGISLLEAVVYYALPNSQIVIIRTWQYLTLPIAWTVGHALLLVTYFLVLWPVGCILRITGYDPLQLRDSDKATTWEARQPVRPVKQYFKQY